MTTDNSILHTSLRFFDPEELERSKNNYEAHKEALEFYEECSSFLSLYIMLARQPEKAMILNFVPKLKHQFKFTVKESEQITLSSDKYMARICELLGRNVEQSIAAFHYFHKPQERLDFIKNITSDSVWAYFDKYSEGCINQLEEIVDYSFPILSENRGNLHGARAGSHYQYDIQRLYSHIYEIEEDLKKHNFHAIDLTFMTLGGYREEENFLEHIIVFNETGEPRTYSYHENISYSLINQIKGSANLFSLISSHLESALDQHRLNQDSLLVNYNEYRQEVGFNTLPNTLSYWKKFDQVIPGHYAEEFAILCEKQKIKEIFQSPQISNYESEPIISHKSEKLSSPPATNSIKPKNKNKI